MDVEQLVEKYGLSITRLAKRMLTNSEMVKDATQETWIELINSLKSFKGESDISTWIYTIAKRTILKYAKNEKRVTHADIDYCISKGQIKYDDSEERKEEWIKEKCDDCITAFCHCLTNEARLIFLFKENLDLTYEQISEIMDMTKENVRQISSRSLNKVRNFMNKNCILIKPDASCGCRIKNEIKSIDFDQKYIQLQIAHRLVDFYNKFDKELPRRNYWEKYLKEVVTN
jgi:RNA polymerase sigma-70 factor (ECF subfamily)